MITAPVGCAIGDPTDAVAPSDAAAWDPRTDTWLPLPRAPEAGGDVIAWAGDRLLVWGVAYDAGNRGVHRVGLALRG